MREVLATEMLEALGVDTSKSFSLIETGEALWRGDEPSPTRSSVLVRLSHSNIRIGTFQRLLYHDAHDDILRLVDHAVRYYLPEAARETARERATAFLEAVGRRVAATGARWMLAGFVHGVLNTDNINITGESFDYGPWRFLPHYDPNFTAAYFDQTGLYAFGRQPDALAWNLTRLAEVLLPLGSHDGLEAALNRFWPAFQQAMWSAALRRLALLPRGAAEDAELVVRIFGFLHSSGIRYEQFWFDWRGGTLSAGRAARSPAADAYAGDAFAPVRAALAPYVATGTANLDHPYFARAVPRTMLIDEVEALWAPIAERDDWSALHRVLGEIEEMRQAYAGDAKSSARPAASS